MRAGLEIGENEIRHLRAELAAAHKRIEELEAENKHMKSLLAKYAENE